MREGIVDFEKLRIILDKAAKSTDPELKNVAGKLKQHLKTLATQKQLDSKQLESDINKGNELIELLSDRLKN